VKDAGLFERVLANEAHKENRTPEEVRRDFLFESGAAVASVLGTTPAAGAVARAVSISSSARANWKSASRPSHPMESVGPI
jgi:hypothetical protein